MNTKTKDLLHGEFIIVGIDMKGQVKQKVFFDDKDSIQKESVHFQNQLSKCGQILKKGTYFFNWNSEHSTKCSTRSFSSTKKFSNFSHR